jgi:hypothetical protein
MALPGASEGHMAVVATAKRTGDQDPRRRLYSGIARSESRGATSEDDSGDGRHHMRNCGRLLAGSVRRAVMRVAGGWCGRGVGVGEGALGMSSQLRGDALRFAIGPAVTLL